MYKKSQKSGRFLVKGLRMQFNVAVVRAKFSLSVLWQ